MKLFCAVVGGHGSAFPVKIDASETVGDLKNAIAVEQKYEFAASKLELFLAKKGDAWLNKEGHGAVKLDEKRQAVIEDENGRPQGFKHMDETSDIIDYFGEDFERKRGEIHVLVVLPEGAGGSPTKIVEWSTHDLFEAHRDSTDKWLAEFHTKRIEYPSLPSIESLPIFIEQPLPVKIPMKRKALFAWSSFPGGVSADVREKMFVTDNVAPCKKIKKKIENMLEPLRSGESESSYHWFWDTVFRAVLDVVFARARMNRDSSKSSSSGNKRPDFLFILNDVCVFRGEEKEPGTNMRLPRDELCDKLAWVYGRVPYVFGYAASGYKIDLFALFRSTSNLSKAESDRLGEFDLELAADRFRVVLALLNLCLLFPAITENCPDSGRDEFKTSHRSNGVVVQLYPMLVNKVFPTEEGFDQLVHIYHIMEVANVPNVDHLVKLKRAKKTVTFQPRGMMVEPRNLLELFGALRNVLEALVVLHRESVMHRDIRWSNVIVTNGS